MKQIQQLLLHGIVHQIHLIITCGYIVRMILENGKSLNEYFMLKVE